jgi:hypothetical protein
MTDHCWSCGGGVKGAKFCPTCGLGGDGAGAFFCVLPAAVTGIAAALAALAGSALLSVPVRPVGFVDGILAIALGTTLPYFDVAMGFVAGWAAVSTLRVRAATPVVAVGLLTSLLYAATLAAVSRAVGRQVAAHDLGLVLGAPALGSLLAGPLATPLGRFTRLGALVDGSPGAVYPLTALLTVVSVASLVILYGIVITAVVVTLALVAIVVAFRIAGAVMSGGSSNGSRARYVSDEGVRERTTRRVEPMFGDAYAETRDEQNNVVSTSRRVEPMFGDPYVETRDADGNVVGTSRRVKPMFGDPYVETRDAQNRVVETSRQVAPMFGAAYVEHRDGDDRVVSESHRVEPMFGDSYVERKDVK